MSNIVEAAKTGVSDLRDPFRSDCCETIRFVIRKNWKGTIEFYAIVDFQNGLTKGEHRINADSFPELVRKVELFTTSLTK